MTKSILVLTSRSIRTARKFQKVELESLVSKKEKERSIVDEILKPKSVDVYETASLEVADKSATLKSQNSVILAGDPKVVQNRVIALSADVAHKWNQNNENFRKQWLKKFNLYTTAPI